LFTGYIDNRSSPAFSRSTPIRPTGVISFNLQVLSGDARQAQSCAPRSDPAKSELRLPRAIEGPFCPYQPRMEVHYRWHALHGRKVRQLYAEQRSGREVVVVEAERVWRSSLPNLHLQ
jgi:hypothetical protein